MSRSLPILTRLPILTHLRRNFCPSYRLFYLAEASCTIHEDTDYNHGANLNDGKNDQDILYLGSCQSFCRSKYPASTHFTFVTNQFSSPDERNACWCKSSNGQGSKYPAAAGKISGLVPCAGTHDITCQIKYYDVK